MRDELEEGKSSSAGEDDCGMAEVMEESLSREICSILQEKWFLEQL